MGMSPSIALVTTETRLTGLLAKWGTKGSAKFRMKSKRSQFQEQNAGAVLQEEATFDRYVEEDEEYQSVVKRIRSELEGLGYPVVPVPRAYVSNYYFGMTEAVVVVGPDGLVANTAKYAGDLPLIGVNPMPDRYDGVLLPFQASEARRAVRRTLEGKAADTRVTLAKVDLSDGQSMLAFNDFYIGRQTHVSARYVLYSGQKSESQSSSGVIIATGAGSTGWLSSVYNMTAGINRAHGVRETIPQPLSRDAAALRWVVREPFRSPTSGTSLVTGEVTPTEPLRLESLMPEGGVIFSDGIESDYLEFNSGAIASFCIAPQQSRLVVPS